MPRSEEKYLSVDKSPEFDRHDDPNNEDFIKANEKGKFVSIEQVADKVSSEDNEEEKEEDTEAEEEIDSNEGLKEVRNDIQNYSYNRRGPVNVPTESFHIDHNNQSFTAITGEGEAKTENQLLHSMVDDGNESLEGGAPKRGVNVDGWDKSRREDSGDNLKTRSDNKIQRDNRGLIRKFLDNFSNKN